MEKVREREIAIIQRDVEYPKKESVFGPSRMYPEYPFAANTLSIQNNDVYQMVRDGLIMMGLDTEHIGQPEWNPLGEIIAPGDYVLLKPNMVLHENHKKENGTDCLITHPSVVRAILDYVVIALGNTGRIVLGDAPLQSCDFERLVQEQGYDSLISFYEKQGIIVELQDFRLIRSQVKCGVVNIIGKENSDNCTVVSLGELSEHNSDGYERLRVTNYNPDEMQRHHNEYEHEYMIATPVLSADVIINLPKPKTHRKAGMTGALKNLIGINGNKDWLPHHKKGSVSSGGDEYKKRNIFKSMEANMTDYINRKEWKSFITPQIFRALRRLCLLLGKCIATDQYHEGSWYGNDTIWRTIIDLNRILLYANKTGKIQDKKQRKLFIIGDMIVSGEGEGPLMPSPIHKGMLLFGWNAVAFDTVVADIMGFDYKKIPSIYRCYGQQEMPLIDFTEKEMLVKTDLECSEKLSKPIFIPTSGWKGYIEKRA